MKRFFSLMLALLLLVGSSAWAQVRVTGGGGASIDRLIGTSTLVTVVLKGGAKDKNLKVSAIKGDLIHFVTESGDRVHYLASAIDQVEVQGGVVEARQFKLSDERELTPEQKQVVEAAFRMARQLFDSANDDQNVKIEAATLLALNADEGAQAYLKQLSESGDLPTEINAARAIYLYGGEVSQKLLRQGLDSGNRSVKGTAVELCGILKLEEAASVIAQLARDRAAEVAAPAARSAARLDRREIIPHLVSALGDRNEIRAHAAMWALKRLGGREINEQIKVRLPQTTGMERFRSIVMLYRLGDEQGRALLVETMTEMPTLAYDAALELGEKGDVVGKDYLTQRLRRREDDTEVNLINRARSAIALIRGGDPQAKGSVQELLRGDKRRVKTETLAMIARLNDRSMLSILQSPIEAADRQVAVSAATTAIALGSPRFRERLLEVRAALEAAER